MKRLTRREIADYATREILAGRHDVINEVAAYLLDSHRVREAGLVVRDIENTLARQGIVVARVSSAYNIDLSTKTLLDELLRKTFTVNEMHLSERIQPELLGGVKVEVASKELDITMRRRINQLKSMKV